MSNKPYVYKVSYGGNCITITLGSDFFYNDFCIKQLMDIIVSMLKKDYDIFITDVERDSVDEFTKDFQKFHKINRGF